MVASLARLLPVTVWARTYRAEDLRADVLAGITLAAFTVPESLAYATLAGLPAQAGLYGAIAGLATYAVFGSARLLASGVTSGLAVLTAATVADLAGGDPQRAAALAALAALLAGAAALAAWACRLGFLANLVSKSVLAGFSTGAVLFVGVTQLAKLFGIPGGQGAFFERMAAFFGRLPETDGFTLMVGAAALILLVLGHELAPKLPSSLIVLVLALLASPLLDLPGHGVKVVGALGAGLPTAALPRAAFAHWRALLPAGAALFVLSYVEGISAARVLPAQGSRLDARQELLANGAGNLLAGLLRGMPVGGSLARSSVNVDAGARTPLSGAAGVVALAVVAASLTGALTKLPETVLAAVMLMAVARLVDVPGLARLFRVSKRDFAIAMATALAVLLFGMLWGVIAGVALSLLDLLQRATVPHTVVLGQIPGTSRFGNRELQPRYEEVDGVLAMRIYASVVFANAHAVEQEVLEHVRAQARPLRLVVLDLEPSPLLDHSAAEMLDGLRDALEWEGIRLEIAGANAGARRVLYEEAPDAFAAVAVGADVGRLVRSWLSHQVTSPY